MELLRSLMDGGHRTLVFLQFTSMLEILERRLTEEKIPYYVITGNTEKEERIKRVKAFNEGNVSVFLISLKAGGTGLNLVGRTASFILPPGGTRQRRRRRKRSPFQRGSDGDSRRREPPFGGEMMLGGAN